MKKTKKPVSLLLIITTFLFCQPTIVSASCQLCNGYSLKDAIEIDSLATALESELAGKMIAHIEDMSGVMDVEKGNAIIFNDAVIVLIPISTKDGARFALGYLNLRSKGEFLFFVESSINQPNVIDPYLRIFSPSGKVITYEKYKFTVDDTGVTFQQYDDLYNSKSLFSAQGLKNEITSNQLLTVCIISLISYIFYIFYFLTNYPADYSIVMLLWLLCAIPMVICALADVRIDCVPPTISPF